MQKLVLFGDGQNAALAHASFALDPRWQVVAFTVDRAYRREALFMGLPVVPFEEVQTLYPPDEHQLFVSISFRQVNRLRATKYAQAREKGYSLASSLHPRAVLPDGFQPGDNCLIGPCFVSPFAQVGNDVVIAAGCVVGHHTVIGDHCFLAAGAVVSGAVNVEPYCLIGAGAVVRDRLTLHRASVIGAGAVILEDTVENGVYLARPAERLPLSSDQLPVG